VARKAAQKGGSVHQPPVKMKEIEKQKMSEHRYYPLMVAAAYGVVSITITLFNKAVFSYYNFKFPLTLFVFQMMFTLSFVTILKAVYPEKFGFPDFEWKQAKKLWPMSAGWWVYGVSGVIALKYLNVPMFSSFRRFTTLIVMFGEYKMRGRLPPRDQQAAVLVMSLGAAVAGFTDLTFSLPGYCWVLTCAVSTALYLLFIDKLGRESGLPDLGLLFYNNLLSFPLMLGSLLLSGELNEVMKYPRLYDRDFQVFFIVSAMQACLLNFLIFLCTRVNSPLITSVTGTVKDLVTNGLGMTLFGDFPFNPLNVASIAICFSGSVWYSRLKFVASQPKPKEKELEEGAALLPTGEDSQGPETPTSGGISDLLKPGGASGDASAPEPPLRGVLSTAKFPPAVPPRAEAGGVTGGGHDQALGDRKAALERQLRELEAQMGGGDARHDD